MRIGFLGASLGALLVAAAPAPSSAQSPFRAVKPGADTPRFFAGDESRRSWAGTGAVLGGVSGAIGMGAVFYHFSHRDGALNNTSGNLGGALVGAAGGAAGGALLGAFIGSLFHRGNRGP